MPLFTPDVFYPHITDIPGRFFKERGLKLAVLDVDNTLTSHNNPTPFPGVAEWIAARQAEGVIPLHPSLTTPPNGWSPSPGSSGSPSSRTAAKAAPLGAGESL